MPTSVIAAPRVRTATTHRLATGNAHADEAGASTIDDA